MITIIINDEVHQAIKEFYHFALVTYQSLTYETVQNKITRLYDGIESLQDYYSIYPKARLRQDWIEKGYKEFICEDFHFAYEVASTINGDTLVIVRDAVHSLMYR